ncbi:MAG: DNA polymerase III subunit delta [Candidatus Schekmanbacteria bacterium]|nr:DNA polymerase III subunit delta [Candidatus Schekmanbacteria bacterium]
MNFQEFNQYLGKNPLPNLYFIHGEEIYQVEQALQILKEKISAILGANTIFISLDSENCRARDLCNEVDSRSLLGQVKIIVLNSADSLKEKEKEQLIKYLSKPIAFNTLIIVVKGKIDQRGKFYSALKKGACAVSCDPLKSHECLNWLRQQAKSLGYNLNQDATRYMVDAADKNLQILNNELTKLICYAGENKNISLADAEAVLGRRPGFTLFQLTDAVRQKELKTGLLILKQLLSDGNHPLVILTMIAKQFHSLGIAKEMLEEGLPLNQIGPKTGLPPFLWQDFIQQAGGFTLKRIEQALGLILEADLKLKSSHQPPHLLLEVLLLNLCAAK